jgi:cell division protease FtsH
VAHFHDQVEPLHKVTIIPRGMSLGATMVLPEKDHYHQRKRRLEGLITFAYGGRAAARLHGEDISAGAADDIRRATQIARMMVREWGMSEQLGPVSYGEENQQVFLGNVQAPGGACSRAERRVEP